MQILPLHGAQQQWAGFLAVDGRTDVAAAKAKAMMRTEKKSAELIAAEKTALLHSEGLAWQREYPGWPRVLTPARSTRPELSAAAFSLAQPPPTSFANAFGTRRAARPGDFVKTKSHKNTPVAAVNLVGKVAAIYALKSTKTDSRPSIMDRDSRVDCATEWTVTSIRDADVCDDGCCTTVRCCDD